MDHKHASYFWITVCEKRKVECQPSSGDTSYEFQTRLPVSDSNRNPHSMRLTQIEIHTNFVHAIASAPM